MEILLDLLGLTWHLTRRCWRRVLSAVAVLVMAPAFMWSASPATLLQRRVLCTAWDISTNVHRGLIDELPGAIPATDVPAPSSTTTWCP